MRPVSGEPGFRPRARVLLLLLLLEAVFHAWVADSEIQRNVYLICYALMAPTALLLVAGPLLCRLLRLTRSELLFVYAVLTATLPIAGFGAVRFLIPGMGWVPHASASDSDVAKLTDAWKALPVLQDPTAIGNLYRSGQVDWMAWKFPIGFWSAYLLMLAGAGLAIGWLVRRSWIEQERLSFPVAQIAIEWTATGVPAWRRPGFWVGASIPVVLQSLLAIHEWAPSVPAVALKAWNAKELLFPTPPWSAIPDFQIGFYPMAIGLGYFMPGPVAFSCCFFWLATRLAHVVGFSLGIAPMGGGPEARFPYVFEQGAGAWIGMAAMTLIALRRAAPTRSSTDVRADRRAAWIAFACLAGAAWMMHSAGVPLAMAVVAVLVAAAYIITAARVRAEAGAIWTFAPLNWSPGRVALELFRTAPIAAPTIAGTALFDLVHVDVRGQALPYLMEGMQIAKESRFTPRALILWSGVFTVIALGLAWYFQIVSTHDVGAAGAGANPYGLAKVRISFREALGAAGRPAVPDAAGLGAAAFGGLFTGLLSVLRARWMGFPFHPIGYVLGLTLTMNAFFVPILIALIVRVVVLRYGGGETYRRSVAFFVGLTLGDIGIQTIWALIGRWLDLPVYPFLS
jgi:hypothetical protein